MQEMFEASVDGEAYDADRWGQYFRPAGMQARTGDPQKRQCTKATATSQSAPAPAAAEAAPFEAVKVAAATSTGSRSTSSRRPRRKRHSSNDPKSRQG